MLTTWYEEAMSGVWFFKKFKVALQFTGGLGEPQSAVGVPVVSRAAATWLRRDNDHDLLPNPQNHIRLHASQWRF